MDQAYSLWQCILILHQGCTNFQTTKEPPTNFKCNKGDMKQVSEDPQILGTAIQNLFAMANWRVAFVHAVVYYILCRTI